MPFTQIGELHVYYEIHGTGPSLLNISGSGGDLRATFPARNPLNKNFTVLHFDQRGLGQTSTPATPYSMRQYADDAAALVGAIGWDHCHVVGASFGGMVAQHLAIHHEDLVDRLVLNCTSPGGSASSFPLHTIQPLDIEARIELLLGLYDCRWDPGKSDPIPGLGPYYDRMIERMRTPREPAAEQGFLAQLEARGNHDVVNRLHHISAPTLVCAGEFDDLAPVANSHVLADRIPNAQLKIFDGGHLFLLQDRSAFDHIAAFLLDD